MMNQTPTETAPTPIDYATGRPIEIGEGKAYIVATCYDAAGKVHGIPTSGYQTPANANQLVTALSELIQSAPNGWPATRIVVTVE